MKIPLVGPSRHAFCVNHESARVWNMIEDVAESQSAKSPAILMSGPVLRPISPTTAITGYGPVRGFAVLSHSTAFPEERLLWINGPTVQIESWSASVGPWDGERFTTLGVSGTLPNDGQLVSMAVGQDDIAIASAHTASYFDIAGATLTTNLNYSGGSTPIQMDDVVYLAGYFIALIADDNKKLQYSAFEDASSWTAADYFEAEQRSDFTRKLIVKADELWALGDQTIQVFKASGDANNPFVPFTSIQRGIFAKRSAAVLGDSIFFVGSDQERGGLTVFRTVGFDVARASSRFLEARMQQMIDTHGHLVVKSAVGSAYVIGGIPFYKLSFIDAGQTFIYNGFTGTWTDSGMWNTQTAQFDADFDWCHAAWLGRHFVGDRRFLNKGTTADHPIYELTLGGVNNNAFEHYIFELQSLTNRVNRQVVRSPHIAHPDRKELTFHKVEFEFEAGVGTLSVANPRAFVKWSDDGGHLWSDQVEVSIGGQAQYRHRAELNALGSSYDRVFELEMSDAVPYRLINGYADVTVNRR